MSRIMVGVALLSVVAQTPVARAADAERVEALYIEGAALYKAGKYRTAIEKFEEAYAIYPEPNLLFNIAKSHEALGNVEEALSAYQRCRDASGVDPEVKAKAEQKIALLDRALTSSKETVEKSSPPPAAPPPPPVAAISAATTPDDGVGMDVAKWGTAIAGVGLLAAGAAVFVLGNSDHQKIEDAKAGGVGSLTQVEARELADSGEQKKTIGTVLGSVGLAAGVTAVVLFIVDADEEPGVEGGVVASEGGASVWMGGRF